MIRRKAMTNLTEYSWYYCKMKDGDIQMLEYVADYFLSGDVPLLNNEVESVLAEVPSYELWKAVHEQWKVLLEENTKLKEQLKECELWFTGVVGNMNDKNCGEHNRNLPIGNFEHVFKVFSQKINQVLGEE
jgi:hypothetical protein